MLVKVKMRNLYNTNLYNTKFLKNCIFLESKFGTDYAELTCPFGGLIRIHSATFGRSDKKKCGGGKIFESCDFEINVKYVARKQCEKKSGCTFLARKAPQSKLTQTLSEWIRESKRFKNHYVRNPISESAVSWSIKKLDWTH